MDYNSLTVTIVNFAIVGGFVSIVMQVLRSAFNIGQAGSKLMLLALALAFGGGVVFLADTSLWPTILAVLGGASTAYGLFIKDYMPLDAENG